MSFFGNFSYFSKVENILKCGLDSIPSPSSSVKIQIMGGKVCLRCITSQQNVAGCCEQTFENKKFVDIIQQCFVLLRQVNFPVNNLNFHWRWRWRDQIQAIFLNLFYFMILKIWWAHLIVSGILKTKILWFYFWETEFFFILMYHTYLQP